MNGLDLLLSYSPHSEAIHQMTLACLLKDVAIARSLGLTGTPKDSFIETNGRLFDITVEMEDGLLSHVELKINATFGDDQVERQRNFVEGSQDEIIYILLGTQQFMTPAQLYLGHWEGSYEQEIMISADGVITLGPKDRLYHTSPKMLNLDDLINALSEAAPGIDQPAVQELAAAYLSCLENIRQTFKSFVSTHVAFWTDASWIGFYDLLRASAFSSGSLNSCIGVPHFTFEFHPLTPRRLAVDDFIEYDVYLDASKNELCFRMSVIGYFDSDDATHVLKRFKNHLKVCAKKRGLPLQWPKKRAAQVMTIATIAVSDLYKDNTQVFGWEECMAVFRSAAAAISDASAAFCSLRA
jgi:hypothetical protein